MFLKCQINTKLLYTDIYVNYNIVTNEITCNGVKIADVKYSPLTLPILKSSLVTLEEQTFVQFNNSKCNVIIKLLEQNDKYNENFNLYNLVIKNVYVMFNIILVRFTILLPNS